MGEQSKEFEAQYRRNYGHSYSPVGPDFARCAKSVPHRGVGVSFHQCQRRNGHGPEGAWCKQHDPEAVRLRRDIQAAKWEAERKKIGEDRKSAEDDKRLRPIYEDALRAIMLGSNDARAVARAALDQADMDRE